MTINNTNYGAGIDYDTALRQIQAMGPAGGAPPVPPPPAPVQDTRTLGIEALGNKIGVNYQKLDAALQKGDVAAARKILGELKQQADEGSKLAAGTQYAAGFEQVKQAIAQVEPQLPSARGSDANTQTMMVGIPGRGGRVVQVEQTAPKEHKGPFGFLGKALDFGGKLLEKAGHVVFFPLELAGKVLDPVRKAIGGVLSGLRSTIDNTLGKIPVIGQAVRFTTGLANSVVGLVDGAIQGVTHPVELIKGLGSMLWTASAFLPPFINARTIYDMAVNGETPLESMKGAMGEGGAILKGFFQNALDDIKQGNWAGALGQVTGDIGSFFVSGGAAGAGKVAATGGKVAELSMAAKAAKLAEAAKATEVGMKAMKVIEAAKASETGAKVMQIAKAASESEVAVKAAQMVKDAELGAKAGKAVELGQGFINLGVETSGKIFSLGLKGNFAAWNKVGKAVNRLPGMQKVMTLGEETAARLRNRFRPQAANNAEVASAVRSAKKSTSFTAEQLGGEIRAAAKDPQAMLAEHNEFAKSFGKTDVIQVEIADAVRGHLIDNEEAVVAALKDLKIEEYGRKRPITNLEEAAEAFKKLPQNDPLRAKVGRQLAGAIQQNFGEALHFPPAPIEFAPLEQHLAGVSKEGKVFIDPALLNEDLGYLANVIAEEQTHAFQRFLADNKDALKLNPRVSSAVEQYGKELKAGQYHEPPGTVAESAAKAIDDAGKATLAALKEADALRTATRESVAQQLAGQFPKGSAEATAIQQWAAGLENKTSWFDASDFANMRLAARKAGASNEALAKLDAWWSDRAIKMAPNVKYDLNALRRQLLADTQPGTQARAMVEQWWAKADAAADEVGYLKYVENDVRAGIQDRGNPRMPASVNELNQRLAAATKELEAANKGPLDLISQWTREYNQQYLERDAKDVAREYGREFGDPRE